MCLLTGIHIFLSCEFLHGTAIAKNGNLHSYHAHVCMCETYVSIGVDSRRFVSVYSATADESFLKCSLLMHRSQGRVW